MSLPDWARAHGPPLFAAAIRTKHEEFDVTERLGVEFSGDGEHDLVYVRKTGANTEWVARQLSTFAAVPVKDIGYCGLKDRHAVARQWFSVPRWNKPDWRHVQIAGVEVLEVRRHSRKLRRGTHRGNRFRIVLRGACDDQAALHTRLRQLQEHGVPNFFGPQRFGRGGSNLELVKRWSSGDRMPRNRRSLAISAARSFLFNQLLDARVRDNSWNRLLAGDVANLDGTRSIFSIGEPDSELESRCSDMDIHPTGLLWGDGADTHGIPSGFAHWLVALGKARVKPQRRSLRLRVGDLKWTCGSDTLLLEFELVKGAFATAVLREIADVVDANR